MPSAFQCQQQAPALQNRTALRPHVAGSGDCGESCLPSRLLLGVWISLQSPGSHVVPGLLPLSCHDGVPRVHWLPRSCPWGTLSKPMPSLNDIEGVPAAVRSYLESSLLEAPLQTRGPVPCGSFCCPGRQTMWGLSQCMRRKGLEQCETRSHAQNPFGSGRGAWTGMNEHESNCTQV